MTYMGEESAVLWWRFLHLISQENFASGCVWTWNLVSDIKGGA
jgi:hypothetical protein